MTYHPQDTSVYLFGGFVNPGYSSETWKYPTSRSWSIVSTSNQPGARQFAGFTADTANDVGILFGGSDQFGTFLYDTWQLGASYQAAGRYTSAVFDSLGANVVWGELWWNRTPANQPLNTFLRFQVSTGSALPRDGTWTPFSADCFTSGTYFTSPGAALPSCFD